MSKEDHSKSCYVFAAGGTGGHIFPALAIAPFLQKEKQGCKIHFVGTRNGLESKIIPKYNFPLHYLSIGRLNNNVSKWERIKTLLFMPFAILQSAFLLLRLRPRVVIGVGGHASGPLLLTASILRFPTLIWEPNAFPGMANRYLAPMADRAVVLYEETKKHLKSKNFYQVGYPVRERIEQTTRINKQPDSRLKLFVFGGSQGSRAINEMLWETIKNKEDFLENIEVVHQTGSLDYALIKELHSKLSEENQQRIHIFEFIDEMEKYYQWADLALCRCGAGTLAELAAMKLPGILVPLPYAADNHQQKNAEEHVKAESSVMLLQQDWTMESFVACLYKLKEDPEFIDLMAQNIHKFYQPQSAAKIANLILELG